MKKSTAANTISQFKVRMVYGFKTSHQVVVLGHIITGTAKEGMSAEVSLNQGVPIGEWKIKEILDIDFINDQENTDFIGLVLQCETVESYNLLQSLRVYGEVLSLKA